MVAVSEVDLEKRVVEKFMSLQKKLREDGYLNSQNQRIYFPPGPAEDASDVPDEERSPDSVPVPRHDGPIKREAQMRKAKASTLASRARGVRIIQ